MPTPSRPVLRSLAGGPLALLIAALCAVVPASADTATDLLSALRRGLRSDDAQVRGEVVTDIGRYSNHLDERQKRKAAVEIHKVFKKEADVEVRRLMVRAFARLHSKAGWVRVIGAAFGDHDPQIRDLAWRTCLGGRADFLEAVTALLREDEDPTYRAKLIYLLRDRRKTDAYPLLLDLLRDKHPRVVSAAAEALEAISGEAFGYDADTWRGWHERWRGALPEDGDTGPSTATEEGPVDPPPPHVGRRLHPEFMGLRLTSKDILFAVDISGSVGGQGLDRARRRLVRAVEQLGSDVHVGAIFFSEEIVYFEQGAFFQTTPENKQKLAFFLRGLGPGSRTDILTPLQAALTLVRKRIEEKQAAEEPFREPVNLVFVSDGQQNVSRTPIERIEEALDRIDLSRAVVHSVVLGEKHNELMFELARLGGGHYVRAP